MSTNFPTTLDTSTTLPAESASTPLSVNHVVAHQNIQDALEAVEAKIGVDSSAVTTSHDYKLGEVTSSDKAVGKTATQTLTNKTLTAPVITSPKITVGSDAVGDLHYTSNSDGTQSRRGIGSSGDVLTVTGGVPVWSAPTAVADATWTTKGIKVLNANSDYYAADSGSSTAYVITFSPAVNAYATGQSFKFKAGNTNTSTAPTLNINSLGTKTIINTNGSVLMIGAILANSIYEVTYNGTAFELQNPTVYQEFIYTSGTSTWVAPRGVSTVLVDIVGSGGGGGTHPGNDNNSASGGGGGAGATNVTSSVTALNSYSVVVGAGGTANNNGNTTSFNGISKAGGGAGADGSGTGGTAGDATAGAGGTGRASGSQVGGVGGTGTGGGTGGAGGAISGSMSGGGGGGASGIGGTGGTGGTGNGGAGQVGGAGAGGGGGSNQGTGGAGGTGLVVIKVPINQYA
jgi:hypothetical protein